MKKNPSTFRTPRGSGLQAKLAVAVLACLAGIVTARAASVRPPNVVVVMTDDQGYGDLRCHGNTMIRTPQLDRLHAVSVRLTDYHVDPTCSPTRSALMTGRYSTRTGVWHTVMGRSLMRTEEVTLAELLGGAGYRTAIFGKWHLGDNYPSRPQDQGFQHVFIHGGGGIGQTPDTWGNDYFDDTFLENGRAREMKGYCTDVLFEEAMRYITDNRTRPFFVYLPTNVPHGPYNVPESFADGYRRRGVPETMARFYGMIENLDWNVGRLWSHLEGLGLERDTILIFTTDNGTAAGSGPRRGEPAGRWKGFNAGMRGAKGSEYDGGHRVPFFVRWPGGGIGGGRDVEDLSAHVDVLPTLAELCGVALPAGVKLDGTSQAGRLRGAGQKGPERTLFVHSQRVETPEKWKQSAVMTKRWRLINGRELYDIQADPGQRHNLADQEPKVMASLREAYEGWWKSLAPALDRPVPIVLGAEAANPVRLTAHDWHAPIEQVPWNQTHIAQGLAGNGYWVVRVERAGLYEISLRRWPWEVSGRGLEATHARLTVGAIDVVRVIPARAEEVAVTVKLRPGLQRLQTWLLDPNHERENGAYYVQVRLIGP